MTRTIGVKGMMCVRCEAHVKKALEEIEGVISAAPSHEKGSAVIEMDRDVAEDALKKAVEEAGYEYLG